jgi:hypothetical protein
MNVALFSLATGCTLVSCSADWFTLKIEVIRSSETSFPIPTTRRYISEEGNMVNKKKLHGLSPRANYTDRATVACRRSDCQLVRIEGATWSA